MVVISVHIYGVKIIFKNSGGKVVFIRGFHGTPLMHYTNGSMGYLMQLSV